VSSEFGQGSEFKVSIPTGIASADLTMITAEQAMTRETVDDTGPATAWQFDGQRILVVDDSPENRELVSVVLEESGLEIDLATNGQEACDKALAHSYELILMDMQMPVMDGYEATAALRREGLTTTIYAFTAHALSGFDKEIDDAGCDGYLTKPIDIDHMLGTLAGLLGGREVQVDRSPALPLSDDAKFVAEETRPTTVAAPIHSRLADNNRLRGIIASFVERMPAQIAQMREAIELQDHETISNLAHWLKGSGGSVGFDDFTEPAKQLEDAAKSRNWTDIPVHFEQIENLSSRIIAPGSNDSERTVKPTETKEINEIQS
jgi:CheY-like chemotaxis protein